ncbi:MAG: phosphoribosylformylglycinamidine synthase subunit PurS [Armatimonadota bacterium]|nr:phosphoribosylformylglycinamidine synthase subunit PurS [Armatimonadota bacterium]MCX7777159.1 phosphoribosylformylglycinamidine synthase subunit PurS [Armatimonadota bacterium]MDW8024986.1 phosphoribosylformylglycinamidine synthase subunit PurS [Armatimonadota bacterium]
MRKAVVLIRLKPSLMDAQGAVIKRALLQLGYNSVVDVRVGKLIELMLEEEDEGKVVAKVKEMCERLLANPIIEGYEVLVEDTK